MATTPIWPGSSSFMPGQTPFGFYDNDAQFRQDADKVSKFCANRMGYPLVDIELQSGSFYTAFEEAVTTYGNEMYLFQIRNNFLTFEGNSTGSTGFNYNNNVITPNLGNLVRLAEDYASEAGVGGYTTYYSGAIMLTASIQTYDMNAWAALSASLEPGDSIEIKQIFYEALPESLYSVYGFDNYYPQLGGSAGLASPGLFGGAGYGAYGGLGNMATIYPVYWDLERINELKASNQVRRVGFSFELINNQLRIFPVPTNNYPLYFNYIKRSERGNPIATPYSGSNLIADMSKVPYANPTYSFINSPGRYWIFEYTLAISKELLGYVRGKYGTVPIPGAEVTLNQDALITAATAEKISLIEKLRGDLDEVSRQKQLERKAAETTAMKSTLNEVPLPIYIG
jgi:hypothetical protein